VYRNSPRRWQSLLSSFQKAPIFGRIRTLIPLEDYNFYFYEQETLGATDYRRRFIDRLCARHQGPDQQTSRAETPNRI
jgi:hypothetical protein